MEIRWCGHSYFFIKTQSENSKEEAKIVIDPFSEEIGLKPCEVEADILLITHQGLLLKSNLLLQLFYYYGHNAGG